MVRFSIFRDVSQEYQLVAKGSAPFNNFSQSVEK